MKLDPRPSSSAARRMAAAFALTFATLAPAMAQDAFVGLAPKNRLVFFTSAAPSDAEVVKVTGLPKREKLLGIDRRPATGQIYALGSSSRLYVIDASTGAATPVGTEPFAMLLSGSRFGFDFNPTVDRIRITSNTGQNLRVHPDTGALVLADGPLAYATGDTAEGVKPKVVGSAYTNSVSPTPLTTTLYNIDAGRDTLVTQIPPNDGTLNTIGSLGLNVTEVAGFDISVDGIAYASLQKKLGFGKTKRASLYTIDLATGAATLVGKIGGPYPLHDLTALPPVL